MDHAVSVTLFSLASLPVKGQADGLNEQPANLGNKKEHAEWCYQGRVSSSEQLKFFSGRGYCQ